MFVFLIYKFFLDLYDKILKSCYLVTANKITYIFIDVN
jgi:hypothetical protein